MAKRNLGSKAGAEAKGSVSSGGARTGKGSDLLPVATPKKSTNKKNDSRSKNAKQTLNRVSDADGKTKSQSLNGSKSTINPERPRKEPGESHVGNGVTGLSPTVLDQGEVSILRSTVAEAVAVLLAIAGVFYLMAIVSHWWQDGISSVGTAQDVRNWMGQSGQWISGTMVGLFGWGALLPGGLLIYLSIRSWPNVREPACWRRYYFSEVVGLTAMLTSSSSMCYLFFGRSAGGAVGEGIGELLGPQFNQAGSALILWLGAVFGYCLAFKVRISAALQGVTEGFVACLGAFFRAPKYAFSYMRYKSPQSFLREDEVIKLKLDQRYGFSDSNGIPEQRLVAKVASKFDGESAALSSNPVSSVPIKVQRGNADDEALNDFARTMRVAKAGAGRKVGKPYELPSVELLSRPKVLHTQTGDDDAVLIERLRLIEAKLLDFGIQGKGVAIHSGPVITLFEFEPAPGVKINRIANLQDDLAMSLKAASIRIIAPLPKKGTVGIEVPNSHREMVFLKDVLESAPFSASDASLPIGLGKDIYGTPIVADIAKMPHLLIAGATGTGKSVCINSVLLSLLYRCTADELGLILIDPKILELSVYEGIPHLKVPVVTNPKMARAVLEWAVQEMDKRYRLLQRYGVRNIDGYNSIVRGETTGGAQDIEEPLDQGATERDGETISLIKEYLEPLDKIVIVIDELADLMLSVGKEVEDLIARLAQKARAAGIHLIVATQRPSVDVITGLIKANFPVRISFRVTSKIDSRTILDSMGSEKLLGKGDMLMMAPAEIPITRIHGAFVSDEEVNAVIASIKSQASPRYDQSIIDACERALTEEKTGAGQAASDEEYDSLYDDAVQFVIEQGKASTSMVQRKFKIGYNRAARIVELMEQEGVVGAADGAKPRQVLVASMDL